MDEEECPHGLGEPAWCVLCNGREARELAEEELAKEGRKIPFWLFKKDPPRKGTRFRSTEGGDPRMYREEFASRIKDRQRKDWDQDN